MNIKDCPHGHQLGKCDTCDLIVAERRIAELERVAEAAEIEYREQYSYGHTSKDTIDALFDALDAAGYLKEQGE